MVLGEFKMANNGDMRLNERVLKQYNYTLENISFGTKQISSKLNQRVNEMSMTEKKELHKKLMTIDKKIKEIRSQIQ
jgi:hypothetical protein